MLDPEFFEMYLVSLGRDRSPDGTELSLIVEYWECVSQLAEDAWEIQDGWVVALDLAVTTLPSDLSTGA